jgi:hypothetical protein
MVSAALEGWPAKAELREQLPHIRECPRSVCANVYGLHWSESLQARMEDAKARTGKSNYGGFSAYSMGPEKKKKNRVKAASLRIV